MEPQTIIPLARSSGELKEIVGSRFKGIVNVLLTPDTIGYLLSLNTHNRNPKKNAVSMYEAEFEKTGYECIALMTINDSGEFADGQHRLIALRRLFERGWKSDPIWQLINLSVTVKMTESIDNGTIRSTVDVLTMHGVVPDYKTGTALKTYYLLTHRTLRRVTADMLESVWESDFSKVFELGGFGSIPFMHSGTERKTPMWLIAGFRLLQIAYGTEGAQKCYDEFYNGESLSLPMVKFRQYITADILSGKKHRAAWSPDTANSLKKLFYAADACIKNKIVSSLRCKQLGLTVYDVDF